MTNWDNARADMVQICPSQLNLVPPTPGLLFSALKKSIPAELCVEIESNLSRDGIFLGSLPLQIDAVSKGPICTESFVKLSITESWRSGGSKQEIPPVMIKSLLRPHLILRGFEKLNLPN